MLRIIPAVNPVRTAVLDLENARPDIAGFHVLVKHHVVETEKLQGIARLLNFFPAR